jgi:hypothetical protein
MSKPLEISDPTAPLRLATAAKIAFPDGSMTASGLRSESKRGKLTVERIAGRDYTTLESIERMRELCRVQVKAPDFIGEKRDTKMEELRTGLSGSSRTAPAILPQAALRARLKRSRLAKPSKP